MDLSQLPALIDRLELVIAALDGSRSHEGLLDRTAKLRDEIAEISEHHNDSSAEIKKTLAQAGLIFQEIQKALGQNREAIQAHELTITRLLNAEGQGDKIAAAFYRNLLSDVNGSESGELRRLINEAVADAVKVGAEDLAVKAIKAADDASARAMTIAAEAVGSINNRESVKRLAELDNQLKKALGERDALVSQISDANKKLASVKTGHTTEKLFGVAFACFMLGAFVAKFVLSTH